MNGTAMVVSKSVKTELLDRLADGICKITPYPSRYNVESVAEALVAKHASLKRQHYF